MGSATRSVPGTRESVRGRSGQVSRKGDGTSLRRERDDLKLGWTVALKFLASHPDSLTVRRLHEEVRIGRQISHPNVCRLHDIAEEEGQPFITMEFVDGEDISSLLHLNERTHQKPA